MSGPYFVGVGSAQAARAIHNGDNHMTMYASVNTKSKKELNDRIATGETILLRDITPFGDKTVTADGVYPGICGPHYPQPHKWYGTAVVKDGKIVKVK